MRADVVILSAAKDLLSCLLVACVAVAPARAQGTIADAIHAAKPGDTIHVARGIHHEPTIIVDRPLTIIGDPGAVLDGANATHILRIEADDVTVRGLTFTNVSRGIDNAWPSLMGGHRCRLRV